MVIWFISTNTYILDKEKEGRLRNPEELFSHKIQENLSSVLPISQKLYENWKERLLLFFLVITGDNTDLSETFSITRSWLKQFLMDGSSNTTMLTALPDKINIKRGDCVYLQDFMIYLWVQRYRWQSSRDPWQKKTVIVNIKSIIPSFLHLFYLDIVLVHDSGLHLLWTKAAVQVCGVVRAEVGGVVGQGLEEAGAVQVATLPSHTTEANNKQFYSLLVTVLCL